VIAAVVTGVKVAVKAAVIVVAVQAAVRKKKKMLQENALWHTALGIYLLCVALRRRFASKYLFSVLKVPNIYPWTTFSSGQGHPCVDCCKHAILGRLDEEVLGL
jgi:Na+-transporting NADH:ubiquinone oxidoreductase subunit NqrE